MASRKKTRQRRKDFLIDTNLSRRKSGKRWRNFFLNILRQFRFLGGIKKLFHVSVLFSTLFICIAVFIAIALFSPYFEIKKIRFVRDNPLLDIEKLETSLEPFYGRNLLFVSEKDITELLQAEYPEFRSIQMNEKWPSEIELQITVAKPFVNILNEETANFWVVSDDGVVLEPHAQENLPTIHIYQYQKPIAPRDKLFEKKTIQALFEAQKFIEDDLEIPIEKIDLFLVSREVHLISDTGMALWIDLAQEIFPQVKKLQLADEKIGLYLKSFDHIDLRIPEQIFYKERGL